MADPTQKPTLLLLPGLLCNARLWRDQVQGLAGAAQCIVADLTQDNTVEAMAARAIEGLPPRFAVAGLSMGGYVALAIMRHHATRVSRLCLMDTSARPDSVDSARRRRGLMALARRGGRFRGVTPRLLPQLLHPANLRDQDLCDTVMEMADRVGPDAFLRQQEAILARPDSIPLLPQIRVPTQVAAGEADALTPPALAAEISSGIPGARLHQFAGAGHLPPLERPDAVTALLATWLAQPDHAPVSTPA